MPKEVTGEEAVSGVLLLNALTREEFILPIAGLFVAIGHVPNTDLFKDYLDLDEKGFIKTFAGTTNTTIPGVFACGDVQDHKYRQAITAAGSGCMAALDAERYLIISVPTPT